MTDRSTACSIDCTVVEQHTTCSADEISFSRQNLHKTVLKVQSCENDLIYDIYTVCAIGKAVNLSHSIFFHVKFNMEENSTICYCYVFVLFC